MRGGAAKVKEADCLLVGGHSIKNPEPLYGLSVTGLVHPRRLITNGRARPGDRLILTKPLGTGIVTTAVKRGRCPRRLERRAIAWMRQLNSVGAELAERHLVQAGTDVTGFGLLGHLGSLCRASEVGAELWASAVPAIDAEVKKLIAAGCVPGGTRENLHTANHRTDWATSVSEVDRLLLADAQTSGGLLLCVPPRRVAKVLRLLQSRQAACAAVVGCILASSKARIRVV